VPDSVLLELQTALFSALLKDESCDDCPRAHQCNDPHGIDDSGRLRWKPHEGEELLCWWPGCPVQYECSYQYGVSLVKLDTLLLSLIKQDVHKREDLTAGAMSLFVRYWEMTEGISAGIKSLFEYLAQNNAEKESKKK